MAEEIEAEIRTLGSETVYRNRWMIVREDGILRRDGSEGIYGVVEKPDFVVILPIETDGSIHLVEQYRYPVGARFWELPQGAREDDPSADPIEVARGELREETGLIAGQIEYVGHLFQAYGYATQGYHIFLARGLTHGGMQLDHEEQGLITQKFQARAVVEMIASGKIKDATTIAALGLLQLKGLMVLG